MLKRLLVAVIVLAFVGAAWGQRASSGVVVWPTKSGCDYFIVNTPMGYAVLQLFLPSIQEPERFDNIMGSFERYGFVDVVNTTKRVTYRIWVEDYLLSKSRAADIYGRKSRCARHLGALKVTLGIP